MGAGAIGVEFASFYRDLGAEVTLVEMLPRILPVEDEEIAAAAHKAFEKQGIAIHTADDASSSANARRAISVAVVLRGEDGATEALRFERVILAVGITGNVEDLGLEGTARARRARTHRGRTSGCETGEPGVYAIGDVAGPPWLAHKASHEGVICVERIAGVAGAHPLDARNDSRLHLLPAADRERRPDRAARARARATRCASGASRFSANGKAIALGEPEGFVKTVFDAQTGELLGAHMIGAEVTELIQGFAIARTLETHRGRADAHVFPAPDALGGDARVGARRLRARAQPLKHPSVRRPPAGSLPRSTFPLRFPTGVRSPNRPSEKKG